MRSLASTASISPGSVSTRDHRPPGCRSRRAASSRRRGSGPCPSCRASNPRRRARRMPSLRSEVHVDSSFLRGCWCIGKRFESHAGLAHTAAPRTRVRPRREYTSVSVAGLHVTRARWARGNSPHEHFASAHEPIEAMHRFRQARRTGRRAKRIPAIQHKIAQASVVLRSDIRPRTWRRRDLRRETAATTATRQIHQLTLWVFKIFGVCRHLHLRHEQLCGQPGSVGDKPRFDSAHHHPEHQRHRPNLEPPCFQERRRAGCSIEVDQHHVRQHVARVAINRDSASYGVDTTSHDRRVDSKTPARCR